MQKFIFRLLFSISSFSGILLFFFINGNIDLPFKMPYKEYLDRDIFLYVKYSLICLSILFFAKVVLWLSSLLLENTEDSFEVESIKPIENTYLPVYIGLFVIALSFTDGFTLEAKFLISVLFILWFLLENVTYFNPFFLFLGYRFYEVQTKNNVTVTVITKRKDLKKVSSFTHLTRINNFTFLEYKIGQKK